MLRWKDAATGIQPFMPTRGVRNYPQSPLWKSIKDLFGPIVALLRLILVAAVTSIGAVLYCLFMLIPIQSVRSVCNSWISFICGRLVLFLLGFYSVTVKEEQLHLSFGSGSRPALSLREKSALKNTTNRAILPGDLIVANHASYVDIIYLFTMYSPAFTAINPKTGQLRQIPLYEAIMACGQHPSHLSDHTKSETTLPSLIESCRKLNKPVVLFPEATTSNNRALLRPAVDMNALFSGVQIPKQRVHVITFRYVFQEFSPAYILGGKLSHLIGLCSQVWNALQVRVCFHHDAYWKDGGFDGGSPAEKGAKKVVAVRAAGSGLGQVVETMLVDVSKLKMTSLGVKDKIEFFEYCMDKQKRAQ
ncbi:hypothetical protein HDU80_000049 [Chytriomyces hyalinus]|nr:hypothetical protein HDU80_000049 [Chytriomyces hyalinus]